MSHGGALRIELLLLHMERTRLRLTAASHVTWKQRLEVSVGQKALFTTQTQMFSLSHGPEAASVY